jgi:autotransporter passenger strand-loop-strand repeat protein
LASGSQTITASETDVAGNVGTASLTFALGSAIQTDTNSFGTTVLAEVGNEFYLDGTNSLGPVLQRGGAPVTTGEFGNWTPIGAVKTAVGYDIAWQMTGTNEFTIWNTDSNGNYISNLIGLVPGTSTALESFESIFNQDLNGDGVISPPVVIATDTSAYGTTSLRQIGNDYFLVGSGGSGPELMRGGAPVLVGQYSPFEPIAAVQTATGYDIAWQMTGTNEFTIWNTDSNGNYISNLIGLVSGTSTALESFESIFNQDLNGDGVISPPMVIATDTSAYGTTSLRQIGNDYFLIGSGGSGPELMRGGAPVLVGQYSPFEPIGAVQTATGYDIAWQMTGTNEFTIWNTDSNGNYISNLIGLVSGTSTALESFESIFNQDLNGDGVISPPMVIATDTSAYGTTSLKQIGNDYFLVGSGGSGPELMRGGALVTTGEFGTWTPIGAVQTASGYDIAWQIAGTNEYTVWNTDSNGNYISNLIGSVSGTSTTLESFESVFNQDLNGDGVIDTATTTIQATGAIVLALSNVTQAASIATGASLELTGADTSSVTFQGATGTLILDHSSSFSGQIVGLTGNGNLSSSDVIDLKDIAFASATESYSGTATGGILTVSDGVGDSAHISLVGNYLNSTFTLSSDGHGGTFVVDPPITPDPSVTNSSGQNIAAGQTVNDATISAGNVQHDFGTAAETTINNGGSQIVEAAGVANNTTINGGGSEVVCAGGTLNGAALNGGTLELQNEALTGSSTIDFLGSGLLKLDGLGAYDALVAGFSSPGQSIDFTGVNWGSSKLSFTEASDNASGTLTATDGVHTASITLLGQYTAASFTSVNDGAGGTQTSILPMAETQQSLLTHPAHP